MTIEVEHPEDLMSIGAHCACSGCHQLDFLPFQCSGCGKTYCLDHRQPEAHACSSATANDVTDALVCPLCAKAIKIEPGEDPHIAFDRHNAMDCDPSNYARVHKKPKCPAHGCKEKLTSINSYTCKDCGLTVCLKHRLGSDHGCPGPKVSKARWMESSRSFGIGTLKASISGLFNSNTAISKTSSRGPKRPGTSDNGALSKAKERNLDRDMRSAAESQRLQLEKYRQAHRVKDIRSGAQPADLNKYMKTEAEPASELCPICNKAFPHLQSLIDHASLEHQEGWSSGTEIATRPGESLDGAERCQHCGCKFRDEHDLAVHLRKSNCSRASNASSERGKIVDSNSCIIL